MEGYVELMIKMLPENKMSKRAYNVIRIAVAIISVVCFFALLLGFIAMLSKDGSVRKIGTYAFFTALAVTLIQVTAAVIGKKSISYHAILFLIWHTDMYFHSAVFRRDYSQRKQIP